MIYLRCQCPLCFRGHCNLAKHVTLFLNGPNVPNVSPVSIYDTLGSNCKCTIFLGPIRLTFLVSVAHRDTAKKAPDTKAWSSKLSCPVLKVYMFGKWSKYTPIQSTFAPSSSMAPSRDLPGSRQETSSAVSQWIPATES